MMRRRVAGGSNVGSRDQSVSSHCARDHVFLMFGFILVTVCFCGLAHGLFLCMEGNYPSVLVDGWGE